MTAIRSLTTVVSAALLGSACVVSVDSQGHIVREEKRFSVEGVPDLRLATFDGAIEVQSWDEPEILVEIEKRGTNSEAVEGIQVTATQAGNRIDLEVKGPRSESFSGVAGYFQSTSAKLIVSVPKRADLRARTGDGSIRVARLDGRLELRTGDGSIRANEVSGQLSMSTGDGSITLDDAEGQLDVDTGDGGVQVRGTFSSVRLHTGDGSIVCRAEPGGTTTGDWEITTGDGSVTLYLPADFSADLDAHTGDGTIRNELDVMTVEGGEESRRTIRGQIGSGGRLLRIRTGDGSIRLHSS